MDKSATVDVVVAEADENRESTPPPPPTYVLPREAKKQNKTPPQRKWPKIRLAPWRSAAKTNECFVF
jgi:hypothetical protein